jgi:transcriptional regulator with XRE-family HTH domain
MITKEQCAAARGLLGWTAKQLSKIAKVGVMTISRFEAGRGEPYPATRHVIQLAFEAAGVEFIPENGGGPGVRLRKTAKQGTAPDPAPEPDSEPGQGYQPG